MEQRLRYIIAELEKDIQEQQAVCKINHRYGHDTSASLKRIEVLQEAIKVFNHMITMITDFAAFPQKDSDQ